MSDTPNGARSDPLDERWLELLYQRVNGESALSRNTFTTTHQWVITLMVGAITAVIAFGGGSFQYPTEVSLAAVLALIPLVFRFFVRSCLEYTLFHRWLAIRNALDTYFYARTAHPEETAPQRESLTSSISAYYFEEHSARPFIKMIWDNLRLAFLWPFVLLGSLTLLGLRYQPKTPFLWGVIGLTAGMLLLEVIWFLSYRRFRHKALPSPPKAKSTSAPSTPGSDVAPNNSLEPTGTKVEKGK